MIRMAKKQVTADNWQEANKKIKKKYGSEYKAKATVFKSLYRAIKV